MLSATTTLPPTHVPPQPSAVSWAQARVLAHGAAQPSPARTVPLCDAAGLTLAGDLCTLRPLPAFDTAAMDGYAVAGLGPWHVRAALRAGGVWEDTLGAGECVEISTGAHVPAGARAVLPLESAVVGHDGSVAGPLPPPGRHIRKTGEDATAGHRLAPAGTRIGPALLGLAASCGHDTLAVVPRPRVGALVTGDELDPAGLPRPGRVRDALGPALPALISELGGESCGVRHVPDQPTGRLAAAVHERQDVDVVVVTGSTSVGATDQLRRLLDEAGARMVVDSVACRPGHPMLLAELSDSRWVVGLPGNPYAALVAAHTLLGPLIAGLSRRPLAPLPHVPVRGRVRPTHGRTRLVPVTWNGSEARIADGHGAAFLQGAGISDALAAITPGWSDGTPAPLIL
ncbi:molybdopterin molybdotransferase MoeA [Streptomyces sp. NPDC101150]|uniref:molybdopterin molybdotransferase MoeA n=1 Tax=Streptomyces sp. NPDC101150 TaxID=3366114 RepID=UPI0038034A45